MLVIFPVVELVGGGDVEGLEEGGLDGEPGEGEGYVPGIGWREMDRERQDAVAVVAFCISGVPVWLL